MEKLIRKTLRARLFFIIFAVLSALAVLVLVVALVLMNTGDYQGTNKEFSVLEATGDKVTKRFDIKNASTRLDFFSSSTNGETTIFRKAIPNLKIVNSDKHYVEVSINRELADKIVVEEDENAIHVSMVSTMYNIVGSGKAGAYKGMYVDCTAIDITVYARVTSFYTDAIINLDYEAPKAEKILVAVSGDIANGKIHSVDCDAFGISVCGDSYVEISGNTKSADIMVNHSSLVDASQLAAETKSSWISNQLFGLSGIKWETGVKRDFFQLGFILSVLLVATLVLCVGGCVFFLVWFLKSKKELKAIEKKFVQQ